MNRLTRVMREAISLQLGTLSACRVHRLTRVPPSSLCVLVDPRSEPRPSRCSAEGILPSEVIAEGNHDVARSVRLRALRGKRDELACLLLELHLRKRGCACNEGGHQHAMREAISMQ